MPSSHNIIKRNHSFSEEQTSLIQTKLTVKKVVVVPKETSNETHKGINYEELATIKAEVSAAKVQKEQLIFAAEQEAETLKADAVQTGFAEGQISGYEAGYSVGYLAGMQKAEEESVKMKENSQQMLMEAEAFVEKYYKEQKEALLDLAGHMAETIVHKTIDTSSEQVMDLVKPVIHRLRRENQLITLSVRPEQNKLVKEKLSELEKEHPEIRFAVLTDNTLDENGCTIESAHAIVDLQIRKQLDAMLTEMKEME
ncbi:flagellar assembly protein FliH [Carnobacterium iners]|uniref:Flagellar assembly protein FliH n=1 Tax=Carnobacterium iners TaxID=1073423 RepID=A0A1X7N235_9LACT|nr:FliH/SctL family protein [Carnobacterium iners]SEK21830.1 flagellar assembly protein FliH [Carnobacterium iners]SMH30714.1 flagellar assembly protein FliH [Carnobacterium iners]